MKLGAAARLTVGVFVGFAAGVCATYLIAVRPMARWLEEQPLYFLSEQAFVLKHARSGQHQQMRQLVEQSAWQNIRALALRAAAGTPPPEPLKPDIAYNCELQRNEQIAAKPEASEVRKAWCKSLAS